MKFENSSLSTPAYTLTNDERHLFKSNDYTGNAGAGAFDYRYQPTSNITSGVGVYNQTEANASSGLYGEIIAVHNESTTGGNSTGLTVSATADNWTNTSTSIGINTNAIIQTDQIGYGIKSHAIGYGAHHRAIYARANDGWIENIGVEVLADGNTNEVSAINYGVKSFSTDGVHNIALFGEAEPKVQSTGFNIGVQGLVTDPNTVHERMYGVHGSAPVEDCVD